MTDYIENIVFIKEEEQAYDKEQIIPELTLNFIVSGRKELRFVDYKLVRTAGDIALVRKNELFKSMKMMDEDGFNYQSVSIFFTHETLKKYAAENNIQPSARYSGKPFISLSQSPFIRAYFESFLPYFSQPEMLTSKIAAIKTNEALELLLHHHSFLEQMIFDLTEPFKIDLEKYINKNFTFNIPLKDFARLTGRSLSTFKRDFKAIYNSPPEKWLRKRRLDEAKYLITEKKQKPSEVYYNVGFENLSHFSVAFKERFGCNPSKIETQ